MTLTGPQLRFGIFGLLLALGLIFIGFEKVTYTAAPSSAAYNLLPTASSDFPRPPSVTYSFTEDADRDGLTNAKELIYGSDPNNPDTDNDGYKDGAEVEHGFDPLVPGSAKLADRPNLSLTIRYFAWAQAATSNPDPQLDDKLISQFFASQHLTDFHLPAVAASDLIPANSTLDAVKQYLTKLSAVALPTATQDYSALASASFQGQSTSAADIAEGIAKAYRAIAAIAAPPQALDLQRRYLASLTILAQLFRDLPQSQKDPVLIALDQQKGGWLKTELGNLETIKDQLIAALQPSQSSSPQSLP